MTTRRCYSTLWARALTAGAILAAVAGMSAVAAYGQLPPSGEMAASAPAQSRPATAPVVENKELTRLWDNFIHGIKVARADLSESMGKAILESGASPREVYLLSVKETDIDWLLKRGEGLEGLKPVIDAIRRMIEEGYQTERSDPVQIANSIEMLSKSLRSFEIGKSRLVRSGEYAMPQLIQKLTDRSTSATLRERIIAVLPELGKDAVRPLSAVLRCGDEGLLQIATDTLGKIRYAEGAAALKEVLERKDISQRTSQVAAAALAACGGERALARPIASVLYDQAERYYYKTEPTYPGPETPTANVWLWREGLGLTYTPVPREIFGDIYAMRLSRQALAHDGDFYPAVSLWLAAKMRKEVDLPAGAKDPIEQPGQPSAKFYALAGSARYMQDVLGRALRDNDAALALRAIEALAQTAGAGSLVEPPPGGVQPLVEALTNRNRRVRVTAALTLADALPRQHFNGDEMVMVVLDEALRQVGKRKALLLAARQEERNLLKDSLRTAGYEVIDFADPDKAIAGARQAGGADIVVVGSEPSPVAFVERIRTEPVLSTLPVVVIGGDERAQRLAKSDAAVLLVEKEADAAKITEAIAEAAKLGGAAQSGEQGAWAVRAARAVELLGRTGNPVYDLSVPLTSLVTALGDQRPEVATAAGKALAVLDHRDAQRALADSALVESAELRARITALELLGESLRRFGNLLTDAQTSAIVAIVTNPQQKQDLRDAAAAAVGAMDLPSKKIQDLILTGGGE